MLTIVNRKAFGNAVVNLSNHKQKHLKSCIWRGPKGFRSKPALCAVYGPELDRLFRDILKVPNATRAEAEEYLEQLRRDESTTMTDVAEVYVFLETYYAAT